MAFPEIYGACDHCSKFFEHETKVIFLKENKDKLLNLEYCNDDCLNACKEKYNFLKNYNYDSKIVGLNDKIDINKLNNSNQVIGELIIKYPDYCIKNYDNLKYGENPIIVNGTELLNLLINFSLNDSVNKRIESFIKECKEKNLF